MIKKLIKEIDRLEQSRAKKLALISSLQTEVNTTDDELKKLKNLQKQYEKLSKSAEELLKGD